MGRASREALLVAGLGLWQGRDAALDTTMDHLQCDGPGGKGVVENRAESPHQDTEAVYMHHESQGCLCFYPRSLVLFMGSYSFFG